RERGGRGLYLGVGDLPLLLCWTGDRGGMVGLRFGDVGPCSSHVKGGLIERLLRGVIAARQRGHTDKLRFYVGQLRLRLGDLGCERGDLLGAHTGIDMVAGGGCRSERGAGLRYRGSQFERRELGNNIAGAYAGAFRYFDGRELATDLGREAHLGRAHDADDGCRRAGTPEEIPAGPCGDQDDAKNDAKNDESATSVSHGRAST